GKARSHSMELIARVDALAGLGRPVLIGVSRKSFIGLILDLPVDQRLEGSLAAAAIAVFQGARIVRAHDVAATVRAVRIADALRAARAEGGRAESCSRASASDRFNGRRRAVRADATRPETPMSPVHSLWLLDLLDIFLVAVLFYRLLILVKGTRSAQMYVGLLVIVLVAL